MLKFTLDEVLSKFIIFIKYMGGINHERKKRHNFCWWNHWSIICSFGVFRES